MDNQNQPSSAQPMSPGTEQNPQPIPAPNPQQVTSATAIPSPAPTTTPVVTTSEAAAQPKLEISDSVAQSLLMINGVQNGPKTKLKLPIGMLIAIGIVLVLVLVASFMIGSAKPQPSKSTGGSDSADPNNTQSVYNQVNKDVNSCSNVVTAVSEC